MGPPGRWNLYVRPMRYVEQEPPRSKPLAFGLGETRRSGIPVSWLPQKGRRCLLVKMARWDMLAAHAQSIEGGTRIVGRTMTTG